MLVRMNSFSADDSSSPNASSDTPPSDAPPSPSEQETDRDDRETDGSTSSATDSQSNRQLYRARPILVPQIQPRNTMGVLRSDPPLLDQLWLPVFLLVATCLSTFFAGAMSWQHTWVMESILSGSLGAEKLMLMRRAVLSHWGQGFTYMACVVGILFAHEMGHYVATRIYKVPASFPFFIPFFPAPIGTMGAVIAMQNQKANRKEIFDIGIAGPLAGLVLAIPIICLGIAQLDVAILARPMFSDSALDMRYDMPLLVRWLYAWLHPQHVPMPSALYASQVNPMFMAGWVGLLITGLNMLPLSQLDGGHVTYTLFGKHSRTITRVFIGIAILYMVWKQVLVWALMLLLIFAIGIYHPPTSDDTVPLGRTRIILGSLSLLIPVLCFPPRGLGFF